MQLLNRKSKPQRILETVNDSLDTANRLRSALPGSGASGKPRTGVPAGKALRSAIPTVPRDKAVTAGLVAGGLVGLTAGSAGISSLRRRKEGGRDDS